MQEKLIHSDLCWHCPVSYDDENRLVSVTPLSPYPFNAVVNAYDHRNRRIRKDVWGYHEGDWRYQETHTFVWDGWNIVLEQITFADSTTRTVEYFWGSDLSGTEEGAGGVGGLLATRIDGVFYIPVYGGNGNIMMYVGENGSIAAQYDYDPYGNILQSSGPLATQLAIGFSTKYHDREVGLVAYQLRTYDPAHGRWLNRDPIGERGGVNLYAYVGNHVVGRFDTLGLAEYMLGNSVVMVNQLIPNTWCSIYDASYLNVISQSFTHLGAVETISLGKLFGLDAASDMLGHFVDNSGDLMIVSIEQMMSEEYTVAQYVRREMNDALRYAEMLVTQNNKTTLISTPRTQSFSVGGFNWGFAIHGFSTYARAVVTKCGGAYRMSWHLYLHDLYDWDPSSSGVGGFVTDHAMSLLHRNGLAREFVVSGRYDVDLSWRKGQRLKYDGVEFSSPTIGNQMMIYFR